MKFLTKFYFLPFFIGIVISGVLFITSYDLKLNLEGIAKLEYKHSLSDKVSNLYWETAIKKIIKKFTKKDNLIIEEKRGMIRFYSKDYDLRKIEQSYLEIQNEIEKYKKDYMEYLEQRFKLDVERITFTKKMEKKLLNSNVMHDLRKKKFLLDLEINKVLIRNNNIISIVLLISFFITIILYNIKKVKF